VRRVRARFGRGVVLDPVLPCKNRGQRLHPCVRLRGSLPEAELPGPDGRLA
jgi:hypothetical protein